MSVLLLLKGMVVGISIAAPVGPIGVLCIRRTLVHGKLIGFLSGLGAATADAIYGVMAGSGLTVITGFLIGKQLWLQAIGGLFLCCFGARIILSKPSERAASAKGDHRFMAYASTLFLTLTNPMTILTFLAIFAGFGFTHENSNALSVSSLVAGIFLGSALWWLLLSFGVARLTSKLDMLPFVWINRVSGGIIFIFGLFTLM